MLLALAAHFDWESHQVDIQTAFLNVPLKEAVYMTIPEGVASADGRHGNCVKLDTALYELKQASRTWNKELTRFLRVLGFTPIAQDMRCLSEERVMVDSRLSSYT